MYTGLADHGHVVYSHTPQGCLSGGNPNPNPNHNPNPPDSTSPYSQHPRAPQNPTFPQDPYTQQLQHLENPSYPPAGSSPMPPQPLDPYLPNACPPTPHLQNPDPPPSSTHMEPPPGPPRTGYNPGSLRYCPEDIVLCVDTDAEIDSDMKPPPSKGPAAPPGITRLDAIRQALLLFVHAKLQMDSRHRFAIMTLSSRPAWLLRTFTNDSAALSTALRSVSSMGSFDRCALAPLFHMLTGEAQSSLANGRALRMVMIYGRSNVIPELPRAFPEARPPVFTADVVYLHERPSERNQPQAVYDVLVDALESVSAHESFIFESSSGLARVLFRSMCALLAHPWQRCEQDGFDAPKDISRPKNQNQTPSVTVLVPTNQTAPHNPPSKKSSSGYNVNDDPHSPYSLH